MWVTDAEREELDGVVGSCLGLGFVYRQDEGFMGTTDEIGDLPVAGRQPGFSIDQEEDDVGFFEGQLGLLLSRTRDIGRRDVLEFDVGHQAAGIEDRERYAVPLGLAEDAVARRAGNRLDDGSSLADEAIEEGRLAGVRPSNDGDGGQWHRATSLFGTVDRKPVTA